MSADRILSRLWMGSHPDTAVDLRGVDVWVLCAEELQSPYPAFKGEVLLVPLFDDGETLTKEQIIRVRSVATMLAERLRKGKRVLVTCAAGRNRSGLVTAMTVRKKTGLSGTKAAELVRERRKAPALTNPLFNFFLDQQTGRI